MAQPPQSSGADVSWHIEQSLNQDPENEVSFRDSPVSEIPSETPAIAQGGVLLYVTSGLPPLNPANRIGYNASGVVDRLSRWSFIPQTFVTMAGRNVYGFPACSEPKCTAYEKCRLFYRCLKLVWQDINLQYVRNAYRSGPNFAECLHINELDQFRCGLWVINLQSNVDFQCSDSNYDLAAISWNNTNATENIMTFQNGGQDSEGISWPGQPSDETFSQALGSQLTKIGDYKCSLENPCTYQFTCDQVGSWTSIQQGAAVLKSIWGYFALISLQNINQHLSNQYVAVKGALGLLALDTFLIDDYFPKRSSKFNIVNALTGLGTIFTIVGGFIPVVGPGIEVIGTGLPAIGSYLGSAAQSDDPYIGQELFVPRVREIYLHYVEALENVTTDLLAGNKINGAFDIFEMMESGFWVNSSALPKLVGLEKSLRVEILSRSIDLLWKTPTSNKMWVLFVDLNDDRTTTSNCLIDRSGPQASKYCDDGGVYYAYNFVEDGAGEGHVNYPWGGDKLMDKVGINLTWVTEASAKSYRLAQQSGNIDLLFNMTGQKGTDTFLSQFVDHAPGSEVLNQAGRYPGSWTLPVCDAGTWGYDWNWDYTADFHGDRKRYSHPPCLCGYQGNETDLWAQAAGMYNFDTFHVRCTRALESHDFIWPDGVDSVTFSSSTNYTVKKPGT